MTKLNKDGSPDMRYAENQHTHDRKWKRALFCAVLLGFLVACFSVAFITRPRSVKENIFENTKLVPTITPIVPLENTDIGLTKHVVKVAQAVDNYTYKQHAHKPYYNDIIAELRMRYTNWQDAAELIAKESGFDPGAINPTSGACGLAQALPCTKMGCSLSDINCQLDWQWEYIAGRYGTATKALEFWNIRNVENNYNGGWY